MTTIQSLDPTMDFKDQLKETTGPVVLVNMFFVPEGDIDQIIEDWRKDAVFMTEQPGYISAQLHRGTGNSRMLVNVAVWESTEALATAFTNPEFQRKHHDWPEGTTVYPHLFEKVGVEGICVA